MSSGFRVRWLWVQAAAAALTLLQYISRANPADHPRALLASLNDATVRKLYYFVHIDPGGFHAKRIASNCRHTSRWLAGSTNYHNWRMEPRLSNVAGSDRIVRPDFMRPERSRRQLRMRSVPRVRDDSIVQVDADLTAIGLAVRHEQSGAA